MKSMTYRLATGLAMMALTIAAGTGTACAQYYPPGGHTSWHNYAQQAQRNWESRREYFHGPMNVVNRVVYSVGNWSRDAVHQVRHTFGNPDYGYYDRFDRKPVVSRGPNPYGGAYAGYGYANGYNPGVNTGYVNTYQQPVYNMPPAQQYYRATPVQTYQPSYGMGVNLFGR
ncbi:MAG: hypothetical protein HY816_02130 [Candidatus Wallbacteria bacterium]|nr:hypothetical protein [Candidatus Wallbacteria bacterium]